MIYKETSWGPLAYHQNFNVLWNSQELLAGFMHGEPSVSRVYIHMTSILLSGVFMLPEREQHTFQFIHLSVNPSINFVHTISPPNTDQILTKFHGNE